MLNSCLSSIPIYSMSMYLLPKTILKKNRCDQEEILLARGESEEKIPLGQMVKNLLAEESRWLGS